MEIIFHEIAVKNVLEGCRLESHLPSMKQDDIAKCLLGIPDLSSQQP